MGSSVALGASEYQRKIPVNAKERLIVALDVNSSTRAMAIVDKLEGLVSFFKVGIELQVAEGTSVAKSLLERGKKVFLDLKYYDVPETVSRAVQQAASLGVSFLTIHGNRPTIQAAVEGRRRARDGALKLLAVTVLTSLDAGDLREMGYTVSVDELVIQRARLASEAGCDGVIASGQEAKRIREAAGEKLLIITPGIRPEGAPAQDQKRSVRPKEAVLAGADYLVVGRPITNPKTGDERSAAEGILREMQEAWNTRPGTAT
jgi:orotidine-5'-phosphate decarboxylase